MPHDNDKPGNLPAVRKPPTFTEVLGTINQGTLAAELTDELHALVANMVQRAEVSGGTPERSFDDAFQGIVTAVEADTNLSVVLGTPEATA